MTKTHVRHSIAALLVLAFAASGCAMEADESAAGEAVGEQKVAVPSQEVFEYAPDGEEIQTVKATQESALEAKGAYSRTYGSTYVLPLTIGIGQSVNYSTSGGSVGVDPVLVLFRRHDNSATFSEFPYTAQRGIRTMAINDDVSPGNLQSSISYTNTSGRVENAWLMVFAWANSTGTVNLSGVGTVTVAAGSVKVAGNAGSAWTTNSGGDPWLFTFNTAPGDDGNWEDDTSSNPVNRESTIVGNTSKEMWYVAHGFNSGTTTINN